MNRAYKLLDNETERKKCIEVVEEAKERVDQMVIKRLRFKLDYDINKINKNIFLV